MATFPLSRPDLFPVGTTVKAFPRSNWLHHQLPPSGAAPGSETNSQVVPASGAITFTGLADDTPYYAGADVGGTWRYVGFRTAPASTETAANTVFTPAGSIAATDVQAAIEEAVAEAGGGTAAEVSFDPAGSIAATDVQAAIEEVAAEAGSGAASMLNLASDATPVVGASFADAATGLNIAVTNGVPVRFQYMVAWVANATTTGARFGLNGPSATRLVAWISYNNAANGLTTAVISGYDATTPSLGTASDATNNICIIQGVLMPSASGTLALRVMAEVADPGSITVKAGSSVLYW